MEGCYTVKKSLAIFPSPWYVTLLTLPGRGRENHKPFFYSERNAFLPFKNRNTNDNCINKQSYIQCYFLFFAGDSGLPRQLAQLTLLSGTAKSCHFDAHKNWIWNRFLQWQVVDSPWHLVNVVSMPRDCKFTELDWRWWFKGSSWHCRPIRYFNNFTDQSQILITANPWEARMVFCWLSSDAWHCWQIRDCWTKSMTLIVISS